MVCERKRKDGMWKEKVRWYVKGKGKMVFERKKKDSMWKEKRKMVFERKKKDGMWKEKERWYVKGKMEVKGKKRKRWGLGEGGGDEGLIYFIKSVNLYS